MESPEIAGDFVWAVNEFSKTRESSWSYTQQRIRIRRGGRCRRLRPSTRPSPCEGTRR